MSIYDQYWGYIPLSEENLNEIWDSGTIVLDTNILLNLYRLSSSSTDDFIKILEKNSERVVVPKIVLDEFFNNRTTLIAERIQGNLNLKKSLDNVISCLDNDIFAKYKRSGIEKADYDKLKTDVSNIIERFFSNHIERNLITEDYFNKKDDILNKVIDLVGDNLIKDYREAMSEEDIKKEQKIGENRFKNLVPPGFGDNKLKEGDAKYNDFYIWKSIIKYAKEKATNIIYITDDSSKKDWFHTFSGKTTGPLKELLNEFYLETEGKMIYIYTSSQFIELYNRKNPDEGLNTDLLKEIKTVEDPSFYNFIVKRTQIAQSYNISLELFNNIRNSYEEARHMANYFKHTVVSEQMSGHEMELLDNILNQLKGLMHQIRISEELLSEEIIKLKTDGEVLSLDIADDQNLLMRMIDLKNDFKLLENEIQQMYVNLDYIWH